MGRSLTFTLASLIVCLPGLALAQTCPAAPDIEDGLDRLYSQTQAAPNEGAARLLSGAFWDLWTKAPDEKAQGLLDTGMERLRISDFDTAQSNLDALIDYCPDYAEGYNQRAFVSYLRQDFAAALPDLDRALALQPRHTGALTGKALTLIAMGRTKLAQPILREAVGLNPWLSERHLLVNKTDL